MQDNGNKARDMVEVNSFGPMARYIRDTGKMIAQMDWVD